MKSKLNPRARSNLIGGAAMSRATNHVNGELLRALRRWAGGLVADELLHLLSSVFCLLALKPNARVEISVGDVYQQVDDHINGSAHQHGSLHNRIVTAENGAVGPLPHPRPRENCLGQ